MTLLQLMGYLIFLSASLYYLSTNLQWFHYRINRVIFHHPKVWWHFVYFLIPYAIYELVAHVSPYGWVVAIGYSAVIYLWYRKLDKPLVWTGRIKRFMVFALFFALFLVFVFQSYVVVIPIALGWGVSILFERILFEGYKNKAKEKMRQLESMQVVGVTASYGKTSIKNMIHHLLSDHFAVYATPRSVNTIGGVIKDINESLPSDTQVYVVEMGARQKGDIGKITQLVEPHISIVGKIGPAHIEYFKTLENIRNTKMEIIASKRLQKAFIHESAMVRPNEKVEVYGTGALLDPKLPLPAPKYRIESIKATLEGTTFMVDGEVYHTKILGAFNAENIAVAILVAKELGIECEAIKKRVATLQPVAHRLQRIDAGGKIILDDSFNGNIDGMMAAFDLAQTHQGKRVLVTPGLVEADKSLNTQVARRANEVFDLIVVTGTLNQEIFKHHVDAEKLEILEDKAKLETFLAHKTASGDLIVFANDAPSFV